MTHAHKATIFTLAMFAFIIGMLVCVTESHASVCSGEVEDLRTKHSTMEKYRLGGAGSLDTSEKIDFGFYMGILRGTVASTIALSPERCVTEVTALEVHHKLSQVLASDEFIEYIKTFGDDANACDVHVITATTLNFFCAAN